MNGTFSASNLYAQWYDLNSRNAYGNAAQGAVWRSSSNDSRQMVGVLSIPSLANVSWSQFKLDSVVLTVDVSNARYDTIRLYRSKKSTYDNVAGTAFLDTNHGYTDIQLSGSSAGTQTATLSNDNTTWLQNALKAGCSMYCMYYAGDSATSGHASDHYIRITSFSLAIQYSYAKSKITSTVGADIGSSATINWTNYISNASTKLRIKFGTFDSGLINTSGSSHSYLIPTSWYALMPNSTSGTATVTLYTYVNGSQIGYDTSSFVATVGSSVVPTISSVSAEIVNDNATVASWNIAVQGYSKLTISVSASAGSGASIVSYSIVGPNVSNTETSSNTSYSYTTDTIFDAGTLRFTVTATDSRGRSGSDYVDVSVEAYAAPSITQMVAVRCDSDGTENMETGLYAKAAMRFEWSAVGSNTMTNEIRYKRHQDVSYTVASTNVMSWAWSYPFGGNLDIAAAYDVEGYIVDALGNYSTYHTIIPSVAGFHLGLKNDRARFGGVCEQAGLEVNWDSQFDGSVTVKTSKPYPLSIKDENGVVGAHFINSNGVCQASLYDAGVERNYLGNGRFSCYDSSGTEQARLSSDKSLKLGNTTLTEAQLISLLNMI